jgi:hypothetical protein
MPEDNEQQPALPGQANPTARPPFPVHLLSPRVRAMAEAVAALTTTGSNLPAAVAASIMNACICGSVRVMHRSHPELVTPTGTFHITVGVSGSGKSMAGKLLMGPIYEYERRAKERFKKEVRPRLEAKRVEVDAEIKYLSNEASKNPEDKSRSGRLTVLFERKQAIEDALHSPQYVVEDITVQALSRLLFHSDGRILLMSTDAREFIANLLGRYNNGNPDDSAILKGFSAEPIKFIRKGANGQLETIDIPRTAMSMQLLVQPDKATEMAECKGLQESGLLQRMLFVWTDNRPGRSLLSKSIPPEVKEAYESLVYELMDAYYVFPGEIIFYLSDEAWQELQAYRDKTELAAGDGAHPSWTFHARDAEMVTRLAAGMHAGDHGSAAHKSEISADTIRRAIALMDYYNIFRMMIADGMADRQDDKVMTKLRDLATSYPDGFSPREAQRKRIAGMHKDAEAVQAILDLKVKNGVLQLVGDGPPRYKFSLR